MNNTQRVLQKPELLRRLYVDERQSSREIAALFGMDKMPVLNALHALGISVRHQVTTGFVPTEQELRNWILEDHLTLAEIARRCDVDHAAVRYWLRTFGIPWKGTTWGQRNKQRDFEEPTRQQLYRWYWHEEMSMQQIAAMLGVTRRAISTRFKQHNIPPRRSGWSHKRFPCEDGHLVKSTYELRVDDWLFAHGILHCYEPPLNELGGTSSADFLVGETYIELWGVMYSERYDIRRQDKLDWYATNGLSLVSINYWDFSAQKNDLWKRKLSATFL